MTTNPSGVSTNPKDTRVVPPSSTPKRGPTVKPKTAPSEKGSDVRISDTPKKTELGIMDIIKEINSGRQGLLNDWKSDVYKEGGLRDQNVGGMQSFFNQYLGDNATSSTGLASGIANEQSALSLLQSAARGQTPSAAELQLKSGLNQTLQNQLAAAKSGRGGYNPLAMRQAQQTGQQAMLETNLNQGALRAQEMSAARGQYSEAAGRLSNSLANINQIRQHTQNQISKVRTDYDLMMSDMYKGAMGVASDVSRQQSQIASNETMQASQIASNEKIAEARNKLEIEMQQRGFTEADQNFWRNMFKDMIVGASSQAAKAAVTGA